MLPTSDGGVVVGFVSFYLHRETWFSVYGQRFSADGDRLWGPSGAVASDEEYNQDRNRSFPMTCSDGDDGFWAHYGSGDIIEVCGLNSDGEMIVETPIRINEEDAGIWIAFEPDGEGGFYIAWDEPNGTGSRDILGQHYSSEGEPLWLGDGWGGNEYFGFWHMRMNAYFQLIQDSEFYFSNGQAAVMRFETVNNRVTPVWDDWVYVPYGRETFTSRISVLPDTGIAFLAQNDNGFYFIRVDPDGSPHGDSYWTTLDTSVWIHENTPFLLATAGDSSRMFAIHHRLLYRPQEDPEYSDHFQVQLLTADGTDLWAPDSVLIHTDTMNSWSDIRGILVSDSALVFGSLSRSDRDLFLFKIFPDGGIAGDTTYVNEKIIESIPGSFSLLGAYPNPFNSSISFDLNVPSNSTLRMEIFNLNGKIIASEKYIFSAGKQTAQWQPADNLSSGIYFVQLSVPGRMKEMRKIVLMK
jgi:hypothetical protein